jgi:hypothetical protein
MKILMTNNTLRHLAGTETYTYALAVQLTKMGHAVSCYSPDLGQVAARLTQQGISVAKAGPSNVWLPPMFGSRSDHQSRYQGRRAICVVLTLALLMLGLAASPSGHTHARPSDGWYNAECPLAELTARAGLVSVLSAPPAVSTGLIDSGTVHAAAPYVPAPVVLVAGSRAPPLA